MIQVEVHAVDAAGHATLEEGIRASFVQLKEREEKRKGDGRCMITRQWEQNVYKKTINLNSFFVKCYVLLVLIIVLKLRRKV